MESQDEKARGEEQKAVLAPLVLSEEQIEEISRKLESLEDQVKRLQVSCQWLDRCQSFML